MIEWSSTLVAAAALLLVMLLGFASQRAGVCTVNAVAEIITTRRAWLLVSFLKAALWAAAIYGLVALLSPGPERGFQVYAPPFVSLAGGFVFGVGAAINGGCSMSTLQKLTDGDLWMALTLAGMVLGFAAWSALDATFGLAMTTQLPVAWSGLDRWALPLVVVICGAALWEAARLWRSRDPARSGFARLNAPAYRLSTAALLIGICGGVLYGLKGAWSYTNYLRTFVDSAQRHAMGPGTFQLLLFAALLAGMLLSAALRRSFRLRQVPRRVRVRRFAGGALMGLGAGAIPGGNDTLLLTGIPTLSLWALGVYLCLLAGVAAVLLVLRGTRMGVARVECIGDVCHERPIG